VAVGKANAIPESETIGSLKARKPIFSSKKHYILYFSTMVISKESL